jgi:hypothetical protein
MYLLSLLLRSFNAATSEYGHVLNTTVYKNLSAWSGCVRNDGQTGAMTELIIALGKVLQKQRKRMVWHGLDTYS